MGLWDTNPADWSFEEDVGEAKMDQEVRDRMKAVLHLQKSFGNSGGQGNAAGGGDTQLTSYDVSIPAGVVANPGNGLIVEGMFQLAQNTNTKTVKLQVGSGNAQTIFSTAQSVAGHRVLFRMLIRRRTATDGALQGIAWINAGNQGIASPYLVNIGIGTVAWESAQTLKVYAASSAADDLVLADYSVAVLKGDGVLV